MKHIVDVDSNDLSIFFKNILIRNTSLESLFKYLFRKINGIGNVFTMTIFLHFEL